MVASAAKDASPETDFPVRGDFPPLWIFDSETRLLEQDFILKFTEELT
jgi:hypothetical protein